MISDKNAVRLPYYYWKAFCYQGDDGTAYSWVYYQINENDQLQSLGENMVTTAEFSRDFYDGQPIFDDVCQSAGLGPWQAIKNEWQAQKERWGCDYTFF